MRTRFLTTAFVSSIAQYSSINKGSLLPMCSVAKAALEKDLYRQTPLIYSDVLSQLANVPIYLKLDCLQASGSFKDRGMAHLCLTLKESGTTRIISSSGGNAGLAAATVAKHLGMDCQVVVPETTKQLVIDKLKSLGAKVQIVGHNWNAADAHVRQLVRDDPEAAYVPPYEHELLWTGHSTLVDEILQERPDIETIVVSVGGGGLLCGVLEGLERNNKSNIRVLAAETEGAKSFGISWLAKEIKRLDHIESVATSLGALQVSDSALSRAMAYKNVESVICSDPEAVNACLHFSKDHRILVEPACGAAFAVVYSKRLRDQYIKGPTVIEVCGGSGVNLELLHTWKEQFGL